MSESNNIAMNNNNLYIYRGGKVGDDDKDKIVHVRIDESVTVIDEKAFYYCTNLQTVEFSQKHNVFKKIGEESFNGCHNLISINMQDTQMEIIGNYAFSHCPQLVAIQFPSSIREIGKACFRNCCQLKVIDLSHVNSLKTIGEAAFEKCYALTTVTLPPTLSRIGKECFRWCKALETVDLRAMCIDEIGEAMFCGCTNLTNIYFPTTIKRIAKDGLYNCKKLVSLDIQTTSIEMIGDFAFQFCSSLTTVNLPETLKFIGMFSFYSCSKLEYVNLHETSIAKIGEGAFSNCTNLTTIVGIYPSHQETADDGTFHSGNMRLPASLVEIGKNPFSFCPKLENTIDNNRTHYLCDINRGGRQFLQRDRFHRENNNDDDNENSANENVRKTMHYPSSLWPLILYRVLHEMELPQHAICPYDDDLLLYTKADPLQRRASVVFYLLIHGVIADLLPQTQSASMDSSSGLQVNE